MPVVVCQRPGVLQPNMDESRRNVPVIRFSATSKLSITLEATGLMPGGDGASSDFPDVIKGQAEYFALK